MYRCHHSVRRRVFVVEFCAGRLPQTRQFHLCISAGGDLQFLLASHIRKSHFPSQKQFKIMRVLIKTRHHPKSLSKKTMAASTRWICALCGEMGKNLQDLEESFKKRTVAKDEEEAWMGCMTCDQSFHIKCLLGEVTEEVVDKIGKDMEKEANRRLKKAPIDDQGK